MAAKLTRKKTEKISEKRSETGVGIGGVNASSAGVTGVSLKPKDAIPFTADHCGNCGLPVMLMYVVYAGREGRYEPRHAQKEKIKMTLDNGVEVEEEQVVLFNGDGSCPVPERSKYAKYLGLGSVGGGEGEEEEKIEESEYSRSKREYKEVKRKDEEERELRKLEKELEKELKELAELESRNKE